MAIESFQIDPEAGGVSQTVFDNHIADYIIHTHNYEKMTGCDEAKCLPHTFGNGVTEDPN